MDGPPMLYGNGSYSGANSSQVTEFLLICFPEVHGSFLSGLFMFCLMVALICNMALIIIICADQRLHHPMYYFLAMLAVADILLCTVATPKTLAILWTQANSISTSACFSQMFFILLWSSMESSIFLVMAYDRYVAICHPLHYPSVVTNKLVAKAIVFILTRNLVVILPIPLLSASLDYCSRKEILHCFCENMSVEKLACDAHPPGSIYGLVTFFIVGGSDLLFIVISYAAILRTVVKARSCATAFKAFRICSSHLILICFFYFTIATTIASSQTLKGIPRHVHVLLALLHHLIPPALNPIVYGVMTKEIREAAKRLLGKAKVHP
ncbi:olfactory receptor 56A4-like [Spea bombifrons]|uniref:olfactory receptor 56A4-like n=1 Tax=Spea bombifrons TaxID=233779 RepID=UPI002348F664|nr:olfactory receptor 56A4-like [Spea bombifrons]